MIHGLTIDSRNKHEVDPLVRPSRTIQTPPEQVYREVCIQPLGASNQLNIVINSRLNHLDHLHCPRLQGTKERFMIALRQVP